MKTSTKRFISMLALMPISFGSVAAQTQHPNPNALLQQWLAANTQENIDTALNSARQHASKGERDAAIADYRKVLSLSPKHPDAVAGLKALGLSDASIASPPPTFGPPGASPGTRGQNPSPPPTGEGGGGGGILGGGLY